MLTEGRRRGGKPGTGPDRGLQPRPQAFRAGHALPGRLRAGPGREGRRMSSQKSTKSTNRAAAAPPADFLLMRHAAHEDPDARAILSWCSITKGSSRITGIRLEEVSTLPGDCQSCSGAGFTLLTVLSFAHDGECALVGKVVAVVARDPLAALVARIECGCPHDVLAAR